MAASSPKRKRVQDAAPLDDFRQLTSHPILQSDIPAKDEGSPRAAVASRLQKLDILNEDDCAFETLAEPESKRRARPRAIVGESPPSSPCPQPIDAEGGPQKAETTGIVPFTFKHTAPMPGSEPSGSSARPKSPTLSGKVNDLYWMDAEITGHNPNDPADDGYGINGIGFRPTAGQAHQLSQRRKQQLADYRSRETKDARQRRSERRRMESTETATTTVEEQRKARVHFEEA